MEYVMAAVIIKGWPPAPAVPEALRKLHREALALGTKRIEAQAERNKLDNPGLDQQAEAADVEARGSAVRTGATAVLERSAVQQLADDRKAAARQVEAFESALSMLADEAVKVAAGIDGAPLLLAIEKAKGRVTKAAAEIDSAIAAAQDAHQLLAWLRRLGSENTSWGDGAADLSVSLVTLNHGDPQAPIAPSAYLGLVEVALDELRARWAR
jgi:hypothetical protein